MPSSKEKKEKPQDGEGKWDKVGDFVVEPKNARLMAKLSQKNIVKGEMALKHAVGLGQQPNVVPITKPALDGPPRPVEVGWHPVGGVAGKWFAQDTGLGKMITEKINKYPDPTQHWAVLVGDFAHQLWMDEKFDVIYINERINREDWQTFNVGETCFNDDAIRRAGESVIQAIRDKQPGYNLITNNCQTYALQLLDAIKADGHTEFGTTLAVYDRLIGPGKVKDLFSESEGKLDAQEQAHVQALEPATEPPPPLPRRGTVSFAQQVMNDNTTQLNPEEQLKNKKNRGGDETDGKEEKKKSKSNFFSRILKK